MAQAQFIERTTCINCGSKNLTDLSRGLFSAPPLVDFIRSDPWGESPLPHFTKSEWVFAKCVECEQMFHRHILNEEWNEIRFSRWMSPEAINQFRGDDFYSSVSHVEHILRIKKLANQDKVRLLDFGCGYGDFVSSCRRFGFDAVGVDRSEPRRKNSKVPIFSSLEEVGSDFHVATMFEVLEHLNDPSIALSLIANRLTLGGILVLETPDCSGITGINTRDDYLKIHPIEHINAFTNSTLRSIAEQAGFKQIDKPLAVVTGSPITVFKRLLKQIARKSNLSTQLYFRKV